MGNKSAARFFSRGLDQGQRSKEFNLIQGLREREADESTRRFDTRTEQFESEVDRSEKNRTESEKTRKSERKEDKAESTRRFEEGVKQHKVEYDDRATKEKAEAKRAAEEHTWKAEEQDRKSKHRAIKKQIDAAKAFSDAGDHHRAGKIMVDLYNEQWPSSDEARILHKDMNPENPIWQKYPEHEILVTTKESGPLPVKTTKDFLKMSSGTMGYDRFTKDLDDADARVAAKNDAEMPQPTKDGFVKQNWKLENGNVVKDGDPVPYEGPVALSGGEKKAAESGLDVRTLSEDTKKTLAGTMEKEKRPAAPTEKDHKEKTARFKADMDMMLKPFTRGGVQLLVSDTGELSKAGESALSAAKSLLNKYKQAEAAKPGSGKDVLTTDERSKLAYARDAVQAYDVMQQYIKSRYIQSTGSGEAGWKNFDY